MSALESGGTVEDAERAAMQAISGKSEAELDTLKTQNPDQYDNLANTAALFPSAMVESELGEVPEGWTAKEFGSLLSKTIGGDWGKDAADDKHCTRVCILRGTDLPKVFWGEDESVPTRFVEPKKLDTRQLVLGDLVIEVSGGSKGQPTGRSLFMHENILTRFDAPVEPASFCRLLRPVSYEVGLMLALHLRYIYDQGKTWLYQNQSTGISNFQMKVFLKDELVVVPPSKVLTSFYEQIEPILRKLHSGENQVLERLRDTLLPKLLSGELTLPYVEEHPLEPADV